MFESIRSRRSRVRTNLLGCRCLISKGRIIELMQLAVDQAQDLFGRKPFDRHRIVARASARIDRDVLADAGAVLLEFVRG